MAKFKLTLKKNPQKREEAGKWYANPIVSNSLDTRAEGGGDVEDPTV